MPRELKSEEELRALIKQRVLASTGHHMPPPIRIVRTDLPGNDWNWMVLDPLPTQQVVGAINQLRGEYDLDLPRSTAGYGSAAPSGPAEAGGPQPSIRHPSARGK